MDAQSDHIIKASVQSLLLYFFRGISDAISHVKLVAEWHGRAKLKFYWQVLLSKAFFSPCVIPLKALHQVFHFNALKAPPRLSFIIHPLHFELLHTHKLHRPAQKQPHKNTVLKRKTQLASPQPNNRLTTSPICCKRQLASSRPIDPAHISFFF